MLRRCIAAPVVAAVEVAEAGTLRSLLLCDAGESATMASRSQGSCCVEIVVVAVAGDDVVVVVAADGIDAVVKIGFWRRQGDTTNDILIRSTRRRRSSRRCRRCDAESHRRHRCGVESRRRSRCDVDGCHSAGHDGSRSCYGRVELSRKSGGRGTTLSRFAFLLHHRLEREGEEVRRTSGVGNEVSSQQEQSLTSKGLTGGSDRAGSSVNSRPWGTALVNH